MIPHRKRRLSMSQEGQALGATAGNASEKGAGPQPQAQKGEAEIAEEEQVILSCHPPTLASLWFLLGLRCFSGGRDDDTCT